MAKHTKPKPKSPPVEDPVSRAHDPLEAAKAQPSQPTAVQKAAADERDAEQKAADAALLKAEKAAMPAPPPKGPAPAKYKVGADIITSWKGQMVTLQHGLVFSSSRFGGNPGISRLRAAGVKLEPYNNSAKAADAASLKAAEERAKLAKEAGARAQMAEAAKNKLKADANARQAEKAQQRAERTGEAVSTK